MEAKGLNTKRNFCRPNCDFQPSHGDVACFLTVDGWMVQTLQNNFAHSTEA